MPPFLLFVHIPKTAGTTLIHLLERNYGAAYQHGGLQKGEDRLPDESEYPEIAQKLANKAGFGAHMPYGLHSALNRPYIYMSFLREPLARTVSHYNFLIRNRPDLASQSIIQFFREGNPSRREMQTRFLAGRDAMTKSEIGEAELEAAKATLRDHIELLGIVERFDESILYIQQKLGWPVPYYLKANQSQRVLGEKTVSFKNLSTEEQAYIRQINHYDSQLYIYACELFAERIATMGADFPKRVSRFQQFNRLYYYRAVATNKLRRFLKGKK
jgi:hypothetical protein